MKLNNKHIFLNLVLSFNLVLPLSMSWADEPPTSSPQMTIIKEYSAEETINGDFEASRRLWLASLRESKNSTDSEKDDFFSDEIKSRDEPSREFLDHMVDKIKAETKNP